MTRFRVDPECLSRCTWRIYDYITYSHTMAWYLLGAFRCVLAYGSNVVSIFVNIFGCRARFQLPVHYLRIFRQVAVKIVSCDMPPKSKRASKPTAECSPPEPELKPVQHMTDVHLPSPYHYFAFFMSCWCICRLIPPHQ